MNLGKEFEKFAIKDRGISSNTLHGYTKHMVTNLTPNIIEERPMNVAVMDVYSRLMMDRIIFLGYPISDEVANIITAQLLFLDSTDRTRDIQMYIKELWNLPIATILISFIIYFIGGYFLYSSFYASIGAAVDSETDSQQFLLPIITPLILAVYIGFFTVIHDPQGTISVVFSIIPITSPIVMMMRIPFGVPWWQLAISITLLFSTFLFVVWFSAKIYRVGILMYGKKPTWKDFAKWFFFSSRRRHTRS